MKSKIFERIRELRKDKLGITQQEFSERIHISRSNLGNIEVGKVDVTDRLISDICREFGVNESWLRTGEGEMFQPKTRNEELSAFFADALSSGPSIKTALLTVMARLTEDQWALLADVARKLAAEMDQDSSGKENGN